MSREIKFRAWDSASQKMISLVTIHENDAFEGWTDIENYTPISGEVMQYTGLKDKNGVEIYERDIVAYYGKTDPMHFGECQSVVEWDDYRCGFYPMTQWYGQSRDDYPKIIGNIYENPELLTT